MLASSREYRNKGYTAGLLADDIEEYFENEGYTTQRADKEDSHIVQAKKGGILRELVAGERAFTVVIVVEPDKFKVSIGVGEWLQNLTVSVLESIIVSPLVFFVEVPISLWSYEIEGKIWRFIDGQVALRRSPGSGGPGTKVS